VRSIVGPVPDHKMDQDPPVSSQSSSNSDMIINALQVTSPNIPLGEDFTVVPTNDSVQVHNQRNDQVNSINLIPNPLQAIDTEGEVEDDDDDERPRRRHRSIVHGHFSEVQAVESQRFRNPTVKNHRCNHCGQVIISASKANTSNRLNHLRLRHANLLTGTTVPNPADDLRHVLVRWIILNDMPFAVVEDMDFKQLTEGVVVSRLTVKLDITATYSSRKSALARVFRNVDSAISITADCWTSPNGYAFFGIGAHWINSNWEVCNVLLDFYPLQGPHTGGETLR
jgi:hypothetical protein